MFCFNYAANQHPPIKTPTPTTDRSESRLRVGRLSSQQNYEIQERKIARSPTFVSERTYTVFARGNRPSTSRTITSAQSSSFRDAEVIKNGSKSFIKLDKQTAPTMPATEPAFLEVTKETTGQYIWRLEVFTV